MGHAYFLQPLFKSHTKIPAGKWVLQLHFHVPIIKAELSLCRHPFKHLPFITQCTLSSPEEKEQQNYMPASYQYEAVAKCLPFLPATMKNLSTGKNLDTSQGSLVWKPDLKWLRMATTHRRRYIHPHKCKEPSNSFANVDRFYRPFQKQIPAFNIFGSGINCKNLL